MKKKKSLRASLWAVLRVAFIAACAVALGALLLNPPHTSTLASGAHVHSSGLGAAEPAGSVNGVPGMGLKEQQSAAPLAAGQGSNGQQPAGPLSGQGSKGPQLASPADGSSKAANSAQHSLSDAAAEPHGLGTHPEPQNPAPVPRGTVDPAQVLDTASQSLGGCLKEYGDAGQCLPVVPPSLAEHLQQMKSAGLDPASMPHNWTCAEVRAYFPHGIAVRQPGVDPEHLDTNRDGTACGAGD